MPRPPPDGFPVVLGQLPPVEPLLNRPPPVDLAPPDEPFDADRTMGIFFLEELNVDIDDPVYHENGTSKAKRLRCFLNEVDLATAITTLKALWKYREAVRQSEGRDEWVTNAEGQFLSLINRLEGKPEGTASPNLPPKPALETRRILELKTKLIELSPLPPHPRGYAFETWLKEAFDSFGLDAREPFRHRGEQIDDSLVLQRATIPALLVVPARGFVLALVVLRVKKRYVTEGSCPRALRSMSRDGYVICVYTHNRTRDDIEDLMRARAVLR